MSEGRSNVRMPRAAAGIAPDGFASRHRFLLVLTWAVIPVVAMVGLAGAESLYTVGFAALLIVTLAVAGTVVSDPGFASTLVSLGLVFASGFLVLFSDVSTASHFLFFLTITAISLYRSLAVLVMAVTTVAAYTFALAVLVSDSTATGGMDAFVWAGIHTAFIVALALLLMLSWRLDAPTRQPGDGERFRLSFERSPIGMAVLHPSGDFIEVNQAMADMLGYEVRHLIGSNVRGVVHSDDLADLGAAWEAMGNEEGHSAAAWMRFMTSAGRSIWGRLSLSLVAGAPLQRAMVLLQIEDVTHTHLEQRRLEELIRGKDEFVATLGEEMREPLGLLIDLSDESEIDARLSRIGYHAREISVVLDDLIVSARADTTPPLMTPQPVDAAVLCREVVEYVPAAGEVSTDIRASTLWADPEVVRHILAGLIGNAVRYGGPNVSLRSSFSGPDTLIEVADDGAEIPVGDRDRIFSGDLNSGRAATKPVSVGLSLTVGRRLARGMGGDIEYRRTADGRNVFELRLPSEQIDDAPARNQDALRIPV